MAAVTTRRRSDWLVPVGLILLAIVPAIAGVARVASVASGTNLSPDDARFHDAPVPVVLHMLSAVPFGLLGALQFSRAIRRRWPAWHRGAGRVLLVCGVLAAVSGLWMTVTYPWPAGDGVALYTERLIVGGAMMATLSLSVVALWRRQYRVHGAWMMRSYAIGMGAGTQVLTHLPYLVVGGWPDESTRAALMGAGWGINVLVAEWVIARR